MALPTVIASLPRAVLKYAAAVGFDADALRDEAGIDPEILGDPDGRVSLAAYAQLYARLNPEPRMRAALHVFAAMPDLSPLGVIGYVLASSPTIADAFRAYERHARVIGEAFDFEVEASASELAIRFLVPEAFRRLPLFTESTAVLNHAIVRILAGAPVPLASVEVASERDGCSQITESILGAPIQHGRPATVLRYAPEVAHLPVASSDPSLFVFVERHAEALRERLGGAETWMVRVRRALLERLRGREPTLLEIARSLGVSERTLSRRLGEEGTSFAKLLDAARAELALRYVRDPALSIAEIAFLLGYSEVPPFHRAFRRWTGQTPAQHRRDG